MSDNQDVEELVLPGNSKALKTLWPKLDEPRQFKDKKGKANGKLRYESTFLLPDDSDDLKTVKSKLGAIMKAKWGTSAVNPAGRDPGVYVTVDGKKVKLKLPLNDGNAMAAEGLSTGKDRSFCAGGQVMKTATEYPVAIFDARKRDEKGVPLRITDKEAIKNLIYGGSHTAAEVKFRSYDAVGTNPPGITAYLQKICFVSDGDRIASEGGGDTFKAVQGAVVNTDPTGGAGMDDEIPF